ncbi:MAG: nitroreductase family deazaflavin-dependent oxidoreductase [Candidatus Bathyarchaeota archaeon]|jgi:deazaflavin-dependent oxidoreductase (nitroreductase family)|nr:nitroreductase family deazaflavin-dependent oxidoreductase [Candidatus Bathyarchaeota archaeon]
MPFPKSLARFNKHVTNRFTLLLAGWVPPLAMVNHRGRSSGRGYRTPVLAFPDDGGFVFALTYGRDVDWVKNLRAHDSGSVEYGGSEIPLQTFRFIAFDEVKGVFPLPVRVFLRLLSVEDCVKAEKIIPEPA